MMLWCCLRKRSSKALLNILEKTGRISLEVIILKQGFKDALSYISGLQFQNYQKGQPNYSYFPVIFKSEEQLFQVEQNLNEWVKYPRSIFILLSIHTQRLLILRNALFQQLLQVEFHVFP